MEFVTPEEVVAPSSLPATAPAGNQASSTTGTEITVGDRPHPITVVFDQEAPGSSTDARGEISISTVDDRVVPLCSGDSQDHPAVEIAEEITGKDLLVRVFVGSIPSSAPPITHVRDTPVPAARVERRPITLAMIDPHGVYPFEEGMALVRAENHRRLDGNHGTQLPPVWFCDVASSGQCFFSSVSFAPGDFSHATDDRAKSCSVPYRSDHSARNPPDVCAT